jgi:hypothetical protein
MTANYLCPNPTLTNRYAGDSNKIQLGEAVANPEEIVENVQAFGGHTQGVVGFFLSVQR